jgi:hypothetical protein
MTEEKKQPKPKESKHEASILEHGILVPGAVLAGSLLLIATGIGVFKFFSGGKKKKEKPKTTKLDG